jgi:hypothetical protein
MDDTQNHQTKQKKEKQGSIREIFHRRSPHCTVSGTVIRDVIGIAVSGLTYISQKEKTVLEKKQPRFDVFSYSKCTRRK